MIGLSRTRIRGVSVPAFDPLTVAGLSVWYDLTNCTVTSGKVSALPDKSGNARHSTISGAGRVYTASNGGYAGRPTLNRADATDSIKMPNMGITTGPLTIVFVGDAPSAGYNYLIRDAGIDMRAQGGQFRASGNGGVSLVSMTPAIAVTNPSVVVAVVDGASSRVYSSSTTSVSGDTGTRANLSGVGFYVGDAAGGGSGGLNFTHVLVYSGALSNADCGYLISGFGAQAGITIA